MMRLVVLLFCFPDGLGKVKEERHIYLYRFSLDFTSLLMAWSVSQELRCRGRVRADEEARPLPVVPQGRINAGCTIVSTPPLCLCAALLYVSVTIHIHFFDFF